ncbi:MAG: acyl carrier protein [Anaerolineales bacterium]|nr:acyl carrier protein [Anaerolineales bacterium]
MSTTAIVEKLKAYVVETFLYDREDVVLTADLALFEERIIDSMGIFRLVTFMNEAFEIVIQPDEIVLENFGTIADMTRLVAEHLPKGS